MNSIDPHEHLSVNIHVEGRVQQVGFRFQCLHKAKEVGVCGWVMNNDDGSVSLHLEALGHRVEQFLSWLRGDIKGVSIVRIDIETTKREAGCDDFRLIHASPRI